MAGIVSDSTMITSRTVSATKNVIATIVVSDVPIRAPRSVVDVKISPVVFLCDRDPKYPLTDQLSPKEPSGNVTRKTVGGAPRACSEVLRRISPDMVPTIATAATIRRADFSG